jgi:regulator of sirC expression with transglutaminase-like and TPR domain
LITILHGILKFRGNHSDYYDPGNSYLNVVLERRVGLPILLSLIYMAIGRRLGLDIKGIGFPGHFMVRYQDERGTWFLDPFYGRMLQREDVSGYLGELFRQPVNLAEAVFEPVPDRAIIYRILNNLHSVYVAQQDLDKTLRVLDYLVLVQPTSPDIWRERGFLRFAKQQFLGAEMDLRRYLVQKVGYLELYDLDGEATGIQRLDLGQDEQRALEVVQHVHNKLIQLN